MTEWNIPPGEIERRSFEIIDHEAPDHGWPRDLWTIVRRMIHTSADFEYVDSVRLHDNALESGLAAIREGRPIFTDTNMARSGISSARLKSYGTEVKCLVGLPETASLAEKQGVTRSIAAVDLALPRLKNGVYVIGNAPTALFRLIQHVKEGRAKPGLIVGLPVGFVNAAESKEALLNLDTPYITNVGRKGGSNVAAAVVNALAVLAGEG